MNEFETEETSREHSSRMHLAARKRQSFGATCVICDVANPILLQDVFVDRGELDMIDDHVCHNHARLLFTLKKRHFADDGRKSSSKVEHKIIPGILVDQERLNFQSSKIQNSTLWKHPGIPYANRFALCERDKVRGSSAFPEFQPYQKLKRTVRKHMKIAPFAPNPECACCVCGEARPIMIEVHHVDRERNSARAVFLCLNHHALMTFEQVNEQPDDQLIQDPDERAEFANAMGANGLLNLITDYRDALSKQIPDRFDLARYYFAVFHAPVDEPQRELFP